ncbi:MAG: hypothetical protein APR63_01355 [Desulfuromonas sp. SDB]|nr:MAG: hypothetical protein APR63_01355 [Desulfuromonas sp. SDB]
MITVLNPQLSLKKYPPFVYVVETLLEVSGLIYRLVNRTPCDLAFQYNSGNIPGVKFVQEVKSYEKIVPFLTGEKTVNLPIVETEAEKFLNKCKRIFPHEWMYFSKWPCSSPFAVGLSHDVDRIRYYSWSNVLRLWFNRKLNLDINKTIYYLTHPYQDPYFQIENLALQELNRGVTSTFFFLTVPRDSHGRRYKVKTLSPKLAELSSMNFEIGLHASIKSKKSVKKLNREKEILQKIVKNKINGVRYHYLMKNDNFLVFPDLAGFLYDSSLSSSKIWTIPRGVTYPHQPWCGFLNRKLQIREIVLTVHDMALINGYSFNPQFISRIIKAGGLLTVLWHQRFMASPFENFTRQYWDIVDWGKREKGWFATLSEIVNFCNCRKSILFVPDKDILRSYFKIDDLDLNQSLSLSSPRLKGKGSVKKITPGKFRLNLHSGDVLKW